MSHLFQDGKPHDFNYGRISNFYQENPARWIQSRNHGFKVGVGKCYCLSYAFWELYKPHYKNEHITLELRERIIAAIKEFFPERYSRFAMTLEQAIEPMNVERRYDMITFNDHPDTTFEDIMKVLERAQA